MITLLKNKRENKYIDNYLKNCKDSDKDFFKRILNAYISGDMQTAYKISLERKENFDFIKDLIDPYIRFLAYGEIPKKESDLEEIYER